MARHSVARVCTNAQSKSGWLRRNSATSTDPFEHDPAMFGTVQTEIEQCIFGAPRVGDRMAAHINQLTPFPEVGEGGCIPFVTA